MLGLSDGVFSYHARFSFSFFSLFALFVLLRRNGKTFTFFFFFWYLVFVITNPTFCCVAQWKSVWLITTRSEDRNLPQQAFNYKLQITLLPPQSPAAAARRNILKNPKHFCCVAQWKSVWLITTRSEDRNLPQQAFNDMQDVLQNVLQNDIGCSTDILQIINYAAAGRRPP